MTIENQRKDSDKSLVNAGKLNRTIFIRDNLEILRTFEDGSVDLIYLDPPFNLNKNYGSPIGSKEAGFHFKDMWYLSDTDEAWWGELSDKHPDLYEIIHAVGCINGNKDKSYLIYMTMRLLEMHRVLKDTGSIYLHCDQTMSHSLKLIMDAVFRKENFNNEIVWWYYNGSCNGKKFFARKHDTILFYTKEENKNAFNVDDIRVPHSENSAWIKNKKKGKLDKKWGIPNPKGKKRHDVFDIPTINNMAKERTGYRT